MAEDLNLETLLPKQQPVAQPLILTRTRSRDCRKDSEQLRRRHQVKPPRTYVFSDAMILLQSIEVLQKFDRAFTAECGRPKANPVVWTIWIVIWDQLLAKGDLWYDLLQGVIIEAPPKHRSSNIVQDGDNIYQAICEPDQFDPSTSDHIAERPTDGNQQPDDQFALVNSGPSYDQDVESLLQQTTGHLRNAHRVTVCHALIGTSILGVATSLSLALWWSFAHGDPGSGFTIGSYVLAVFGVLVGIPGYRHSKICQCWESKPKGA